ncbi:MAG: TfuA-like protein [Alishewanella aestuarii]
MASVVVFLGPSLPLSVARQLLPAAIFRPPAGIGDIYQATLQGAGTILLIDGMFKTQPSVWHKEIHYALSCGVKVAGAASMGALRAAELAVIGMQGVGAVFRQYANQQLCDDDEVAVTCGPAEIGFQALSLALVSLRYAFAQAVSRELICQHCTTSCLSQLKETHFPARTCALLRVMLGRVCTGCGCSSDVSALLDFLVAPQQDLKYLDAISLLQQYQQLSFDQSSVPPFIETCFWRSFIRQRRREIWFDADQRVPVDFEIENYFRLEPVESLPLFWQAWICCLEQLAAQTLHLEYHSEAVQSTLDTLRCQLGLHKPADIRRWLAECADRSPMTLRQLAIQLLRRSQLSRLLAPELRACMAEVGRNNPAAAQELQQAHQRRLETSFTLTQQQIAAMLQAHQQQTGERITSPVQAFSQMRGFASAADLLKALCLKYSAPINE